MRKRYTREELEFIESQARQGISCELTAMVLNVSVSAIHHVLSRNGIKFCQNPINPILGEHWINCPGIPDIRVSNMGRFLRISSNSLIHGYITTGGYVTVDFSGIGSFSAHRLIAQAFLPNPENKPEVNHIDGCKTNNCVRNLEWATPVENIQHAFRTVLITPKTGQEHHRTALNEQQILSCFEMHIEKMSYREIGDIYGVDRRTVSRHVNNHRRNTERPETIPEGSRE